MIALFMGWQFSRSIIVEIRLLSCWNEVQEANVLHYGMLLSEAHHIGPVKLTFPLYILIASASLQL